jgi:N-acyl-D-amino-acid deacylase
VTTIVTGNCGFTLAPCRPEDRLTLMKMLEYVAGMSLEAMQKGAERGDALGDTIPVLLLLRRMR